MHRPDTTLPPDLLFRSADGTDALHPAAVHALSLAGDALAQVELEATFIHQADRSEAWQAVLGHLYQAMINLHAVRHALAGGAAQTDAAALHEQVMRRLQQDGGTSAQIEKLAAGDLQDVPPMGRLVLFGALLRETALAFDGLISPAAGVAGEAMARMDAKLRLLGDRLVALADPLLAGRGT